MVFKPTRGGKGEGIYLVTRTGDGIVVNGEATPKARLSRLVEGFDDYLAVEFLQQHEYAEAIYSGTTNTLRVHSLIDPETGEASILRSVHRFGSEQSAPTDNWSQGGYIAPVDERSGRLKDLVVVEGTRRKRCAKHPETGGQVAGRELPHWDAIRRLVCTAAQIHDRVPLIGWDLVVTENGPRLLEGNARPHELGLQLEEGLWTETRFQRLCEHRG